jgi:prepilin-type N-terminal cleavage/methylation domain-containing protein
MAALLHAPCQCRRGFTLIEVMIVAIIITVMAATILPQFSSSARDAKWSSLKFNLRSVRSQLERYKENHQGVYPPAASSGDLVGQLTNKTDSTAALNASGACGPYLEGGLPANPFNDSASVAIIRGDTPPSAATGSSDGWQYNPARGWFYPNNSEYFQNARDSD